MSLRHGLIGLLVREGPLTGYELTKAFDRSVNFLWHAVQGQIYPELVRLAEAGLIRQTATGPRGAKRYEATEEGIAELRRWIVDVEPARGTRSDTLLRVFFSYLVEPAELEAFLERELDAYRPRLAVLEGFLVGPAPDTAAARASALTVEAGVLAFRAQIAWAERALAEVRRWPREQVSEADETIA